MAWGFRKTFGRGPFRVSVNKRSVSGTVRVGPFSFTKNSKGRLTESVRLGGGYSLRHSSRRGRR